MAFIYMAGGFVLHVQERRHTIEQQIADADGMLSYEIDFPAGGSQHADAIAVNPALIAIVSDQPLPSPAN